MIQERNRISNLDQLKVRLALIEWKLERSWNVLSEGQILHKFIMSTSVKERFTTTFSQKRTFLQNVLSIDASPPLNWSMYFTSMEMYILWRHPHSPICIYKVTLYTQSLLTTAVCIVTFHLIKKAEGSYFLACLAFVCPCPVKESERPFYGIRSLLIFFRTMG